MQEYTQDHPCVSGNKSGNLIIKKFQQSDHNPPHFHAVYGEYIGAFDINTLEMIEGGGLTRKRSSTC